MTRPGEYKGMFLPAHEVPMLHPYLVHPARDAPYPLHPMDGRHADFMRERDRQVGVKHAPSTDNYNLLPRVTDVQFLSTMSIHNEEKRL